MGKTKEIQIESGDVPPIRLPVDVSTKEVRIPCRLDDGYGAVICVNSGRCTDDGVEIWAPVAASGVPSPEESGITGGEALDRLIDEAMPKGKWWR